MQTSLRQRSIESTTYNVVTSGVTTVIQFARSIILARILAPDNFGVYAFATAYILVSRAIPQFGLNSAYLHRTAESEGDTALRVHFTLSAVFNLIWAAIMIVLSFILLSESVRVVLWAILATEVIDNLVQTGRMVLVKQVVFRRIVLLDTLSIIIGSVMAVLLALRGWGVWSLVSTDVISAALSIGGIYLINPVWHPRLSWHRQVVKYYIDYGKRVYPPNLLSQALDRIDDIFTGIVLGQTPLGYYSRAYTFATYPRRIIASPLSTVSLSMYAELKDDTIRLSKAFFRVNALMVRSGFYIAGILALIAPEFIRLLLTEKWLPMLSAFRWMLVYTLLDPMTITMTNLFTAIGIPEKITNIRIIQVIVMLISMVVLGPTLNITGVALSVDLMMVVGIILIIRLARKYVQFSSIRLFLAPSIAVVIGITLAQFASLVPGIVGSDWRTAAVKMILFTLVFGVLLVWMERDEIPLILGMIKNTLPARFRLTGKRALESQTRENEK